MTSKKPQAHQFPHLAQIVFTVNVHKKLPDGSLDPHTVSSADLNKHGISQKAIFSIEGYDKLDCITKVKEVLEQLHYEQIRT